MKSELVLPNDFKIASTLNDCCYRCLRKAEIHMNNDNLDEAERWVKEFQRCKRDLDKLIDKKKRLEKYLKVGEIVPC